MSKYLNNLDIGKNQLLSAKLHMLPTGSIPGPSAGNNGLILYDSTLSLPAWVSISAVEYIYPARTTNVFNTVVLRDGSGNFTAGTITATLNGSAGSATILATARNFSITGKGTAASILFNGSADVALNLTALTVAPGDITLTTGSFIVGVGGVGAATAKSSIPLSGFGAATAAIDLGGQRITNLGAPTAPGDATNKLYVDNAIQGLNAKTSVRCASTANVSVSAAPATMDGYTLVSGDRVLLKNQTAPAENGFYSFASAGAPFTRTADADIGIELVSAYTWVENGTNNIDTGWLCTAVNPVTLGTTPLPFVQFSGAGSINAGSGLAKNGSTLYFFKDTSASPYVVDSVHVTSSGTALTELTASVSTLLMKDATGPVKWGGTLPNAVQDNITRTGTITSGTWQSTIILTGGIVSPGVGVLYVGASSGVINKATGIANQVLTMSAGLVPTFGALDLTQSASVTGILPPANGGTGIAFFKVLGPAALRSYIFPDMNAEIPQYKRIMSVATIASVTQSYPHGLGRQDIFVQVMLTSNGEVVYPDVRVDFANVYITMSVTVGAGDYTIIVVG